MAWTKLSAGWLRRKLKWKLSRRTKRARQAPRGLNGRELPRSLFEECLSSSVSTARVVNIFEGALLRNGRASWQSTDKVEAEMLGRRVVATSNEGRIAQVPGAASHQRRRGIQNPT